MRSSLRTNFLCALIAVLPAAGMAQTTDKTQADPFIVHEWGTFTSMQGSDGIALEGLQHEEEALPPMVYSRTKVRECPLRRYGYKGLEVPAEHVTQKMETPVIYFHTKTARNARVRVDFNDGLITQWYPVSNLLGPPEDPSGKTPLDLKSIKRSFVEWDIELIPRDVQPAPTLPAVDPADPWNLARKVSAAFVRTMPRPKPDRLGPVETEQYLFYRGLGTFALPYSVEAKQSGNATLTNRSAHEIPMAFAVDVSDAGARMSVLGPVGAGSSAAIDLGSAYGDKKAVIAKLRESIVVALVGIGLFEDEAEAMVATWSRQWFASDGSRIIYIVPRPVTDSILPLSISPAPDKLVRVLVGRLEYLTPETENLVVVALRERLSKDPSTATAAMTRLSKFNRFLEPNVRRVMASTQDADVRRSAEEVLTSLTK